MDTRIELDEDIFRFVSGQIAAGHYDSTSEVIRSGLRLLRDHETQKSALRAALAEGEQSGEPVSFDIEQFIATRKRH